MISYSSNNGFYPVEPFQSEVFVLVQYNWKKEILLIKFQLLTVSQSQVLVCCLVLYSKTGLFWQVVFVGEEGVDAGGVRKVIYT